jgi:hypothetical protein
MTGLAGEGAPGRLEGVTYRATHAARVTGLARPAFAQGAPRATDAGSLGTSRAA